ncbi:uncharacterized protein LOC112558969 [Pomacea canaliculata]|uniref:uncharacterized protein LOC112558969 n=1 Tax=Pomacea canaliculata TaxID=400727 RepID=UPI000D73072B|nr:uncharacterized protein LOC112558969 [Pomacea canaliculata]XP_025085661.1 uncharacterized protein LOC112558969 [Pomacea canaliculata]
MILLLLPLLMTLGTTWSVPNSTTTKPVHPPTTPEPANGSAVTPKCPSPLCDGFECGEGEYCSTSGFLSPRCRPCSLVAYSCSDMDVVRTKFKGCETFCFNTQKSSLIKNCSIEKGMLSEDLSRCTSKASNASLEITRQQNETSALKLRNLFLENALKEATARVLTLTDVVIGVCAACTVILLIMAVIVCLLVKRLSSRKATSFLNEGERGENQGYSDEQWRKGQNAKDNLDSKQDADKHLVPPQTLPKSVVGGSPTEEALSGDSNRNHLAPTGDRTEHVHGDQNDFLSRTMTSSAHNRDTDPTGEDFMTSSSDNVSNSRDDHDPQWSGYTSTQEESLNSNQPLLPKTYLHTQPEQERHNSEYKYGSNTLLNKVYQK